MGRGDAGGGGGGGECEMEMRKKKKDTKRKRERGGIIETRNLRRRRRNVLARLPASRMTHSYLCPPQ